MGFSNQINCFERSLAVAGAALMAFFLEPSPLFGDELEHLAYPPPGRVRIELQSEALSSPLQIVGSLDPPTLVLNGKPLRLKPAPSPLPASEGEGVWVNSRKLPVKGSVGQFFANLSGHDAAVASLEIKLRNKAGKTLFARAEINRSFLDAPFASSLVVTEEDGEASSFEFSIKGTIPPEASLRVEGGEVTMSDDQNVEVRIRLPLGETVISARIEQPGLTPRILRVPIVVKKSPYDPEKPILSIQKPDPSSLPRQPWTIPYYGVVLSGQVNPGAQLTVGSRRISTSEKGRFSFYLDPEDPILVHPDSGTLDFLLQLPDDGQSHAFSKTILCGECGRTAAWHRPKFHKRYRWYVSAFPLEIGWYSPRSGAVQAEFLEAAVHSSTRPLAPSAGGTVGYHLRHDLAVEAGYKYTFGQFTGENNSRSIDVTAVNSAQITLLWSPVPVLCLGGGLSYFQARLDTRRFSQKISSITQTLGIHLRFQLRFPVLAKLGWNFLEWTPELSAMPAQFSLGLGGSPVVWHTISFQPLAVRFYL